MSRDNKYSGKLAVGIFVDGCYLRVVCLSKKRDKIHLVDAESLVLPSPIDPVEPDRSLIAKKPAEATRERAESINIASERLQTLVSDDTTDSNLFENVANVTSPASESSDIKIVEVNETNSINDMIASGEKAIDLDLLLGKLRPAAPVETSAENEPINSTPEIQTLELIEDRPKTKTEHLSDKSEPIFLDKEISITDDKDFQSEYSDQDNASILLSILNRYYGHKYELALSLPEPQVYYSYFDSDWGLTGKKLKKKIIYELSLEKPDSETIEIDSIQVLKLADGSLMAVVRDEEIGIINILQDLKGNLKRRLPKISVIESAELSLVNLVKQNYEFQDDEISVIVYVGHEFARLIFLQGKQLLHISPIISEGTDSYLVFGYSLNVLANTIRSRLLMEQDDLNISKINHIILCGEAYRPEFQTVLREWIGQDVTIEEIKFPNIETGDVLPIISKDLPQVAVALGAAWHALEPSKKDLYDVELIPTDIREGQKVFKLGFFGWLFLILIPLLTFSITVKIGKQNRDLATLVNLHQQKINELARLREIEAQVITANEKLSHHKNTFGVLDSMLIGTQTWSEFLKNLTAKAQRIGNIWITELGTITSNKAFLTGYSLNRISIPRFSNALGNAMLKKVQVQDIREQSVYNFEIEMEAPPTQSAISDHNWKASPPAEQQVESVDTEPNTPGAHEKSIESELQASDISLTASQYQEIYRQAIDQFNQYEYKKAIDQFNHLLSSGMQSKLKMNCYYWIGESYFGLKDYHRAKEYFDIVITSGSEKTPAALYMIIRSMMLLGDTGNAQAHLQKLVDDYPEHPLTSKAKILLQKVFKK